MPSFGIALGGSVGAAGPSPLLTTLPTRETAPVRSTKEALCLLYDVLADFLSPPTIDCGLDGLPDVADFLRPVVPLDAL